MQETPSRAAAQSGAAPTPAAETAPMPVITILRRAPCVVDINYASN
jgi:hypothetical protein